MADVSLYLANVNVSLGRAVDSGQVRVSLPNQSAARGVLTGF